MFQRCLGASLIDPWLQVFSRKVLAILILCTISNSPFVTRNALSVPSRQWPHRALLREALTNEIVLCERHLVLQCSGTGNETKTSVEVQEGTSFSAQLKFPDLT